jgi:DNA primase
VQKRVLYSRDSIDGLRAVVDPKDIITSLGGINPRYIQDSGDEIRCPCPLHGGDNKSAFSWKRSKGSWTCYTHDCGSETKRDLFAFVSLKLNISFIEAVKRVADLVGYTLQETTQDISYKPKTVNVAIKDRKSYEKVDVPKLDRLTYLPGCCPEGQEAMIEYLKSRNYHPKVVGAFHLYPLRDSLGLLRLGIPVYDTDGDLVGVNARLMDTIFTYPESIILDDGTEVQPPKYKMIPFKKGSVLYNLNQAKAHALTNGLIIVEGQLDVMRLYTYGIYNAVCTMGTSLTEYQAALVYKHAYKTTFLVEEGEPAIKGVRKSVKHLAHGMSIRIAKLPSGDADSNTKDVVTHTITNAVELYPDQLDSFIKGSIEVG